jgi:hypothetical protein
LSLDRLWKVYPKAKILSTSKIFFDTFKKMKLFENDVEITVYSNRYKNNIIVTQYLNQFIAEKAEEDERRIQKLVASMKKDKK